jgi:tRNA(fMet)-specific endonuclease VapC
VVKGEVLALARHLGWGGPKLASLDGLLRALPVADISADPVLEAYAFIDASSLRIGRTMGKNDVWIAAVAHAVGATLLTSDTDFDHLCPATIAVERYETAPRGPSDVT